MDKVLSYQSTSSSVTHRLSSETSHYRMEFNIAALVSFLGLASSTLDGPRGRHCI